MKLIKLFAESIDCQKENQAIMSEIVNKLGKVIKNSNKLQKLKVKELHKMLKKTISLRTRLDIVQANISRQLLLEHSSRTVKP